jgi:hypothetical protein
MGPRNYRITVEGELGDQMAQAFPGMRLTRGHGTTDLTGELHDQAEMQALLRRLTDLGLTLLETKALAGHPGHAASTGAASGRDDRQR